jgi:hypothetical protein
VGASAHANIDPDFAPIFRNKMSHYAGFPAFRRRKLLWPIFILSPPPKNQFFSRFLETHFLWPSGRLGTKLRRSNGRVFITCSADALGKMAAERLACPLPSSSAADPDTEQQSRPTSRYRATVVASKATIIAKFASKPPRKKSLDRAILQSFVDRPILLHRAGTN